MPPIQSHTTISEHEVKEPSPAQLGLILGLIISAGSFTYKTNGTARLRITLTDEDAQLLGDVQQFTGGSLGGPYLRNRSYGHTRQPQMILSIDRHALLVRIANWCQQQLPACKKRRLFLAWSSLYALSTTANPTSSPDDDDARSESAPARDQEAEAAGH